MFGDAVAVAVGLGLAEDDGELVGVTLGVPLGARLGIGVDAVVEPSGDGLGPGKGLPLELGGVPGTVGVTEGQAVNSVRAKKNRACCLIIRVTILFCDFI